MGGGAEGRKPGRFAGDVTVVCGMADEERTERQYGWLQPIKKAIESVLSEFFITESIGQNLLGSGELTIAGKLHKNVLQSHLRLPLRIRESEATIRIAGPALIKMAKQILTGELLKLRLEITNLTGAMPTSRGDRTPALR